MEEAIAEGYRTARYNFWSGRHMQIIVPMAPLRPDVCHPNRSYKTFILKAVSGQSALSPRSSFHRSSSHEFDSTRSGRIEKERGAVEISVLAFFGMKEIMPLKARNIAKGDAVTGYRHFVLTSRGTKEHEFLTAELFKLELGPVALAKKI